MRYGRSNEIQSGNGELRRNSILEHPVYRSGAIQAVLELFRGQIKLVDVCFFACQGDVAEEFVEQTAVASVSRVLTCHEGLANEAPGGSPCAPGPPHLASGKVGLIVTLA